MSLRTPETVRRLQRKLYVAAKEQPDRRFHQLYDKVSRGDVLEHAYRLVRSAAGAPGVDGVTFARIESQGLAEWLIGLTEDLHAKTYRPAPVRRVMIPKPGGGERPLGIPTIRDRVVQTAARLVLEPIFEADFEACAYGYRPKRGARQAVEAVHRAICEGYTDVVDADLSKYFDTIPHDQLMKSVARRVSDGAMLRLIKSWLKAPIQTRDDRGQDRMQGGKASSCGTPQGGVISPLLANIYMHRFLKAWRLSGKGEAYRARIVNYADDFVILSRGKAAEALTWTQRVMRAMGLTLNEKKTRLCDARVERFDFLGYTFGPRCYKRRGTWYLGAGPSKKSLVRLRSRLRELLRPCNMGAWPQVREELNRVLRGWDNYFNYGSCALARHAVNRFVCQRVRYFLARRHKVPTRGTQRFTLEAIFGECGVHRLGPHSSVTSIPCAAT